VSWHLPFSTSCTPALVPAARSLLERVYKPGFVYHKAGVFLTDILAEAVRQQSLLLRMDAEHRLRLMEAAGRIDRKHGRHTVRPLAIGLDREWEMRRGASPGATRRGSTGCSG
jgi:DNA polymerase V